MFGTLFQSCICPNFLEEQSNFQFLTSGICVFEFLFQLADHFIKLIYSHIYL
jgi:hypothetical protein